MFGGKMKCRTSAGVAAGVELWKLHRLFLELPGHSASLVSQKLQAPNQFHLSNVIMYEPPFASIQ